MKIILENESLKSYARTDDAVKAFATAVGNGQARLAMEMLVPIIEALASSDETESTLPEKEKEEVIQAPKPPVDKKQPVKVATNSKDIKEDENSKE